MGLRLAILSRWTPQFIISREVDRVSGLTTNTLKSLLKAYAPEQLIEASGPSSEPLNVHEKRLRMARDHVQLTEELAKAVGKDQAIQLARKALFEVGVKLGQDIRKRLGIRNSRNDLSKAAEVMYRIFDIHVKVEWLNEEKAVLVVNRCLLANEYSEFTCKILSATDEGMLHGIMPNAHAEFKDKITCGSPNCRAEIIFDGE